MATKNKKTKKKLKKTRIFLVFVVLLIVSLGIYFFLTATDEESRLTLLEKQWIDKNKNTLIDIHVPNNLSVLGSEGEGLLFEYLSRIEKGTGLGFNKVAYTYPNSEEIKNLGFVVLKNTDKVLDTDVLIVNDSYVLIGLNEGYISDTKELNSTSIGILETDELVVSNYLGDKQNYKKFKDMEALYKDLTDKVIDYIIVPRYAALDQTLEKKVFIKYNFSNISNKIVLRLGNNEKLNTIMSKYLSDWKSNFLREDFDKTFFDYFLAKSETTDVQKHSLTSKIYTYGYVKGSAYNITKSGKLYGIAGEYINSLKNMADVEFKFMEYETIDELKRALNSDKVDVAFVNYTYENEFTKASISPFNKRFVALSKEYKNISEKSGLNSQRLYVLEDDFLGDYIKSNFNSIVKVYNGKTLEKNDILIIDEADYVYEKASSFADYELLFFDNYHASYRFEVIKNETTLYDLINFMLAYTDPNDYKSDAMNHLLTLTGNEQNFKYIYMFILVIVLMPILIILLIAILSKNVKRFKIVKKEEVLKYNDMLTSLKNRNYLNNNISKWEETKVYPRTIIIIDLNNLKYVNDNYGHEEGNVLIKRAAAVLINTQLENSEIIRSDGNEFLIYLVGYSKMQINTYISKLQKQFESLPHGFGAAVGYSMIEDEINTIDDAISEATIEMRIDKEKNFR